MDMKMVKEISKHYKIKAWEEGYENEETNEIAVLSTRVLEWESKVGTEADTLTFGEYTRRFEKDMKELETLMEGK